jgi:hypothetical protein
MEGVSLDQTNAYVNYIVFKNQFGYNELPKTTISQPKPTPEVVKVTRAIQPSIITDAPNKSPVTPVLSLTTSKHVPSFAAAQKIDQSIEKTTSDKTPAWYRPEDSKEQGFAVDPTVETKSSIIEQMKENQPPKESHENTDGPTPFWWSTRRRRTPYFREISTVKECGARDESSACMFNVSTSSVIEDLIFKQKCLSKGCCWSNEHYENHSQNMHSDCHWSNGHKYSVPSAFPSLKEGLKSCCDSSPCFHKKLQINEQMSQKPEPIITDWSLWTGCVQRSQSHTRQRTINGIVQQETKPCLQSEWTEWRIISNCNRVCGGGTETSMRNCNGAGCDKQVEYSNTSCNTHPCNW